MALLFRPLHTHPPVRTSLAEQKTTMVDALRAGDFGAASLAQAAMRDVLSAPTHSALVELELPADQARMASASLALLAASDGGEAQAEMQAARPATRAGHLDAVLDAIPRFTQAELWQVVERAQEELKGRSALT